MDSSVAPVPAAKAATVRLPLGMGRTALLWAALLAVVFLSYQPVWRAGLVWNDSDYVTRGELQTVRGLGRIWAEVGVTEQYYPLLHSAFWLEHCLWGDAPAGYHLVNLFWHASAAFLLGLILVRLSVPGAWLAAALFALHPVCVESVAWVAEQKNTLSTFFYLAAALAYLRFDAERGRRSYAAATLLFGCALLTKSVTATLPAALLVVFWWRRGSLPWRRDVRPLLPWFALGAIVGLFTSWVERVLLRADGAEFALTPLARCFLAARASWFYLGKLSWPTGLSFIYPRWELRQLDWTQAGYLFFAGALLLLLWVLRHRMRGPLAAALFFAGTLFPVLGFFNVYGFRFSFVADHWQYPACLGPIVLLAAGLSGATARLPRARWVPGLLLTGLLALLTWRQCQMYRDVKTFYRSILAQNPDCWMAEINLAGILLAEGRYEESISLSRAALRLRPEDAPALYNLGLAFARAGQMDAAISAFAASVHARPELAEAHGNLGTALVMTGRLPEGRVQLKQAIRLNPGYFQARRTLDELEKNPPPR